jgi:hypothetical protein
MSPFVWPCFHKKRQHPGFGTLHCPADVLCSVLMQVRGWRGFAQAEWWYIVLSLTSKQLLAWITYGVYNARLGLGVWVFWLPWTTSMTRGLTPVPRPGATHSVTAFTCRLASVCPLLQAAAGALRMKAFNGPTAVPIQQAEASEHLQYIVWKCRFTGTLLSVC